MDSVDAVRLVKIQKCYHRGILSWRESHDMLAGECGLTDQQIHELIGTEEQDAAARAEAGIA